MASQLQFSSITLVIRDWSDSWSRQRGREAGDVTRGMESSEESGRKGGKAGREGMEAGGGGGMEGGKGGREGREAGREGREAESECYHEKGSKMTADSGLYFAHPSRLIPSYDNTKIDTLILKAKQPYDTSCVLVAS